MVWIQIRTNILLVLIWVQTVCKGNQQTHKERIVLNLKAPHKTAAADSFIGTILDFKKRLLVQEILHSYKISSLAQFYTEAANFDIIVCKYFIWHFQFSKEVVSMGSQTIKYL